MSALSIFNWPPCRRNTLRDLSVSVALAALITSASAQNDLPLDAPQAFFSKNFQEKLRVREICHSQLGTSSFSQGAPLFCYQKGRGGFSSGKGRKSQGLMATAGYKDGGVIEEATTEQLIGLLIRQQTSHGKSDLKNEGGKSGRGVRRRSEVWK